MDKNTRVPNGYYQNKKCEVNNECSKTKRIVKGFCMKHYARWKKYGDPNKTGYLVGATDDERFWFYVDKNSSPDDCWLWTGHLDKGGYARFNYGGTNGSAHRFAYETFVERIPEDYEIDHVYENGCRNRHCVNYEKHLEAVTTSENIARRNRLNVKLTDEQVIALYTRRKAGEKHGNLAKEANVSRDTLRVRFRKVEANF